jgi:hypothetical protein
MAGSDDGNKSYVTCRGCGDVVPATAQFCPSCGSPPGAPDAPLVCGHSGHTVEPGYDFCVSCGIDLPSGAPGEADKPEHTREKLPEQPRSEDDDADVDDQELQLFRRRLDPYLENGWEIERDDGDSVDLSYQDFGSAGIHVALVLFLVTIG